MGSCGGVQPYHPQFIKFILSKLRHNSSENYAAALYQFYHDDRLAEKLIANPINLGYSFYQKYEHCVVSYVPRAFPDGEFAICQEHTTDSLQMLLKADYMTALNAGHNCDIQKELARDEPKIKAKIAAFNRIRKDYHSEIITEQKMRRLKDTVRGRLFDALSSPDISNEAFECSISSQHLYPLCRVARQAKPRGRPRKVKDGDGA